MIVDDEPFVRKDIRHMLTEIRNLSEEVAIVCEAGTIETAKRMLLENRLDLVLLDVQLRGGTGFDLVPYIDGSVYIIFITAYDDYAVRAFEVNALDYILKPVTRGRLAEALLKVIEAKAGRATGAKQERSGDNVRKPLTPDDSVLVKTNATRFFIRLNEIVAISSIGGNYASILMKNGEKVVSRKTMKEWEEFLPGSDFLRIHRSAIINIRFVRQVEYEEDGTCRVLQTGQASAFTVSRRMSTFFKKRISEITVK